MARTPSLTKNRPAELEARIRRAAAYIIENDESSVRKAAKALGCSKSTVHMDVTERLHALDYILYKKVQNVLDQNHATRHLRGGNATREKFLKLRAQ